MGDKRREEWLESLTEGAPVQIISKGGRFAGQVDEIREDVDLTIRAEGLPKGFLWVWRSDGTRPDWECYIAPTDAPLDYPSPLTQTECSTA